MYIDIAAKKLKCSTSYLRKLILTKKINAELRVRKSGRKSYFITDKVDVIKPILSPKAGYKRNGNSTKNSSNTSSILTQFAQYRSISEAKRRILVNLSNLSLAELRILQKLAK